MNKLFSTLTLGMVIVATSGCIVGPGRRGAMVVAPAPVMVAPAPVVVAPSPVYVEPTYASPGVGFVWEFHPRFGWGWRHPVHGWHRGWR